jgi:hypothetical protein
VNDADERILDVLYRGVTDSETLTRALGLIQNKFRGRGAVLIEVDAKNPTANFTVTTGWMKENLELYLAKYAHIDPVPALLTRMPAGKATCTNRMFSPAQLKANRFYNEFFRPSGMVRR